MTFLPIEVMLTAGIVLLALALVILSAIATRRKAVSKIKETSARYLAYKALREKYQYLSVEGNVEYYERLESKYKFDHFNFDKYVFGQVCKERDKFEEMLDAVEINRRLLTEFEEEYKLLPDFTENPPSWLYSVLERTVMRNEEKHRKSPTTKFTITCSIRYTSPAGRNRYANHKEFLKKWFCQYH